MGVCGDAVSQVGTDQRAFNDLSKTVGDIQVPNLQFVDRPAIVSANASFRFTFRRDGLGHVRTRRHVLRRKRTAGKGLLDVQSLPVPLKLIGITFTAKIAPHILDRTVHSALEQIVRHLGAPIREAIAFPVRGVEHHLILRHLYLREGSRSSQHRPDDHRRRNHFFHRGLCLEHHIIQEKFSPSS